MSYSKFTPYGTTPLGGLSPRAAASRSRIVRRVGKIRYIEKEVLIHGRGALLTRARTGGDGVPLTTREP